MRLLTTLPLVVAALLLLTAPASGQAAAFEICGALGSHKPATSSTAGEITIGTWTASVAPGTVLDNGGVTLAAGRELCLHGTRDASTGTIDRYTAFMFPANRQICGTFVDLGVGGPYGWMILAAEFGRMDLRLDRSLRLEGLNQRERVCLGVQVDGRGDLVAISRAAADKQLVAACGIVKEYAPARTTEAGRVAVGSRLYLIAAGTRYTGDPLGDRTDRTAVGARMCLSGSSESGQLTSYLTSPMPPRMGGTATEYTPATPSSAGVAVIGRLVLRTPAGSSFPDLGRAYHCFAIGVDKNGDARIDAIIACEPGRVVTSLPATAMDIPAASLGGAALVGLGVLLLLRSGGRRGRGPGDSAGPTPQG